MDLYRQADGVFRALLTALGQKDWISVEMEPDLEHYMLIPKIPREIDSWRGVREIKQAMSSNHVNVGIYWAFSKVFADGPKLFYPTYEQCEALEHVEVNLGLEDYQQAYDAILIYLPKEYITKVEAEMGYCPEGILCFKTPKLLFLSNLDTRNNTGDVMRAISKETDLESFLQTNKVMGSQDVSMTEMRQSERIQRLALNLNLLLCHYPIKTELQIPESVKAQLALPNRAKRREAEALVRKCPAIISFEQEIIVRESRTSDSENHSGGIVSPHWRKGHWMVFKNPRYVNHPKPKFIKPIFVNADKFLGQKSNTKTLYKGEK
jgi:hypothetical protein